MAGMFTAFIGIGICGISHKEEFCYMLVVMVYLDELEVEIWCVHVAASAENKYKL
jgi:hypothetical protein